MKAKLFKKMFFKTFDVLQQFLLNFHTSSLLSQGEKGNRSICNNLFEPLVLQRQDYICRIYKFNN